MGGPCLFVFTAPVWGGGGAILVLTGYPRAGANLMIVAGALTLVPWLWLAPAPAVLAGPAYTGATRPGR